MNNEEWILEQLADGPLELSVLKGRFDRENLWWVFGRIERFFWHLGCYPLATFNNSDYADSLQWCYALEALEKSGKVRYSEHTTEMVARVLAGRHPKDIDRDAGLRRYYRTDYEEPILAALADGEKTMGDLIELFGLGGICTPWWSPPHPTWSACFEGLLARGLIQERHEYREWPKQEDDGREKHVEERWLPPDDDGFHIPPIRYFSLAVCEGDKEQPMPGGVG